MNWSEFRRHFPVTERWTFLDHAAVAPLSEPARAALCDWAENVARDGIASWAHWQTHIDEARRRAAALIHADPLDIAFIKNTSEGIAFVAEGLDWRPGDNVVTSADEYPSNLYPWLHLASRGVEVRQVPSVQGQVPFAGLRDAIDTRTRLLTLSWVEYSTGFRNDLDAVANLCHERGVLFFVDAIQGLGVFPLDVTRTPIDFLAADGHKWLLGPEGAGIVFIRRDRVETLRLLEVGWNSMVHELDFSKIRVDLKPHAGRWECGTLNVGGILAMSASLGLLLDAGIPVISGRVLELTDHLCDRLRQRGVEIYSSRSELARSGIVSLTGLADPSAMQRRCRSEKILVNVRGGRLRISPHAYNTFDELDRLVDLLGGSA